MRLAFFGDVVGRPGRQAVRDHLPNVRAALALDFVVVNAENAAGGFGLTEAIAGEGRILTAGGFDAHIHFICPQQIDDALPSGLTTMLGGGTGPAHGTLATTVTPGPWHIGRMLQAADAFPMNLAFAGKGNASRPEGLVEQIEAGVRHHAEALLAELGVAGG